MLSVVNLIIKIDLLLSFLSSEQLNLCLYIKWDEIIYFL